jgi:hypothetical protein
MPGAGEHLHDIRLREVRPEQQETREVELTRSHRVEQRRKAFD